MQNLYSNIPQFLIYDDCILDLVKSFGEMTQVIKATKTIFHLSDSGSLIIDKCYINSETELERDFIELKTYTEYIKMLDYAPWDWDKPECKRVLLGNYNKESYNRLLSTIEDYKSKLDHIKGTEYANNIFLYFTQVQLEFENWFQKTDIDFTAFIERNAQLLVLKEEPVAILEVNKIFPHGWLTKRIKELAQEQKCKNGETVRGTIIDKWIIQLKEDEYPITSNTTSSIRQTLSRLGFSKEKR
jgi:hypothetical protein